MPSQASESQTDEVRVPAFTAYMLPNPDSARISEETRITRWKSPSESVNWYGQFAKTGEVTVRIELALPKDAISELQVTVAERSQQVKVLGKGENATVIADFGTFVIPSVGFHRIELKSLNNAGQPNGDIKELILGGPATESVHFNLKERRNAASVHLMYPVPDGVQAQSFYCEVTGVEDPTATFYMACGWHRGYFGMQVNSEKERRIIFSVWDSGNEAIDRAKVNDENRVKLMGKGEGVFSGDFGNEGTGGHSHLKYMWKTGDKQRFIVTAQPTGKSETIFSGFWFHPDKKEWMLISSWRAPKEGGLMRGMHSFSENFGGSNGHFVRKALYGNQWIKTDKGEWLELTDARFSHDPTGREDRLDRFMGVESNEFFLSHGGFINGFTKYGEKFSRKPTGNSPADIQLPEIKMPTEPE